MRERPLRARARAEIAHAALEPDDLPQPLDVAPRERQFAEPRTPPSLVATRLPSRSRRRRRRLELRRGRRERAIVRDGVMACHGAIGCDTLIVRHGLKAVPYM